MGGSDQWGNITTGIELIRRKIGGEAYAFTCPLIKKADGGKFGKTEQGNIWLDSNKTTPYQFYQFWLNAADSDAEKWIKIFTFLTKDTIEELIKEHSNDPSKRVLQKKLAEELTIFVHGKEELQKAVETTFKLFTQQNASADTLSVEDLEGMDGIIHISYEKEKLGSGIDVITLLSETNVFPSKGEARKMIQNGGVSINRIKVSGITDTVNTTQLLHDKYLLIQKGKKNYYLLIAQ